MRMPGRHRGVEARSWPRAWRIARVASGARILRRQGLARLRPLEPPVPVQRYRWARAGGLVHLDAEKLGRTGRVVHCIIGDRRGRVRDLGWEPVHVAIDDASGLAYVEVLGDEGGATTTQLLWRAPAWFRRQGIRVIQTLLREWACRRAYPSSRHRTGALDAWLHYYNCARGHGALTVVRPSAPWRPRTISCQFTTWASPVLAGAAARPAHPSRVFPDESCRIIM